MSSMKLSIIKGPNSYTGNLMEKESKSLNRRKEVNFNVSELGDNDKFQKRSKSFAVYKEIPRPRRGAKSTDFSKHVGLKEPTEDELEEAKSDSGSSDNSKINTTESLKKEVKSPESGGEEGQSDNPNVLFKQNPNSQTVDPDSPEGDKETPEDEEVKEEEKTNKEKKELAVRFEEPLVKWENEPVFEKSKRPEDENPEEEEEAKEEPNQTEIKVKDLKEMIREAFDPKEIRERHERNMEKMREQFQLFLEKITIKKEEQRGYGKGEFEGGLGEKSRDNSKKNRPSGFKNSKCLKSASKKKPKEDYYSDFNYDSDDDDEKKKCCCWVT